MDDGDRLAPVSWLFGEPEQPRHDEESDREPGRDGEFERINNVSMRALARRGMSVAEMRDFLARRDFGPAEVDQECDRLLRVGLLDDQVLAETLLSTLRDRKGLGRSGVVAELRRRKIDSSAIEVVLAQDADHEETELDRALQVAARRARQLSSLDRDTAKRRLSAFLLRKGYSAGIAMIATDRSLASAASTGPVFR